MVREGRWQRGERQVLGLQLCSAPGPGPRSSVILGQMQLEMRLENGIEPPASEC